MAAAAEVAAPPAAIGTTRELSERVIWRSRAEWDAFLDRTSSHGAIKLVFVIDPVLTTRIDQARCVEVEGHALICAREFANIPYDYTLASCARISMPSIATR